MSAHFRFTAIALALLLAVSFAAPSVAAPSTDDDIYDPTSSLNPIRNQGSDDVSYAFVTTALAEIALSQLGLGYGDYLSEQYMRYALSKGNEPYNDSGFIQAYNSAFSSPSVGRSAIAAFLLRGDMGGLVVADEDPYAAGTGERSSSVTASKRPVYRVGDVIFYDDIPANASGSVRDDRIELLKEAIAEYGAVGGWIYSSRTKTSASLSTSYWDKDYRLYKFTANNKTANWCVALVGWDDTYDDGVGAFIARNSWGDTAHGVDDSKSGYFYLSYQDYFLLRSAFAIDNPINLDDERIDATYEHDPFGAVAEHTAGNTKTAWGANVFTVTDSNQRVRYVSFAVPQGGASYEVYLSAAAETDTDIDSKLKTLGSGGILASGSFADAGYYTVKIGGENGFDLGDVGTEFVVAVKLTATNKLPIEQKSGGNQAVVEAGQSYASADGVTWTDISSTKLNMNACVKVLIENDLVRPGYVQLSNCSGDATIGYSLELEIGGAVQLVSDVYNADGGSAAYQDVIWSSSDAKIATVSDDGTVTAKKAGECVITARSAVGGKTAKCTVTVPEIEVTSVTLNKTELTLKTNAQETLKAICLPTNASDLSVVWKADDGAGNETDVVSVSETGAVKGLKPGVARITATSKITDTVFAECTVTIEKDYVAAIKASKNLIKLSVGSTAPIALTVLPVTAYDQSVTWTMTPEDSDVAELNADGNAVIAKNPGTVRFTATANDPLPDIATPSAIIEVSVSNQADYYCTLGKTLSFKSTLTVAKQDDIIWKVYDANTGEEASPDDLSIITSKLTCKVSGKKIGEYRIVITDSENENNTQIVHVNVKTPVTKVVAYLEGDEDKKKIRRTEITVDQDGSNPGSIQLFASILPETATYWDVTWKSSKPAVATVDATGRVTAVAPGSAIITCTSASDNKKSTFSVSVKYNSQTLTLNKTGPILVDVRRSMAVKATVQKVRNVSNTIEWTSSDPSVATVKKGKITAVSVGTATITAKTLGGLTQTIEVNCEVLPTRVTVDSKKHQLAPDGATAKINASLVPSGATATDLTYTSRDSTIASVDDEGNIVTGRKGTTTISVVSENGKKASVTVVVK